MAAALFIALPQLPEDIWKVPILAVSSTRFSSHQAWFKDGWKQWAGLGRRDHVFYWQWLTEAQAVKPWVTFTEGTYLKPWHSCRCSEPASGTFIDAAEMFAVHFSRLVWPIGDTSNSDTNMARRCVGWASAAVTRLIWELDMADWLGSRTQLKHLCCSHSHITAGPNKTHGSRRAGHEVAQAQCRTLPVLASKDFALGLVGSTLSVRSVTLACGSVAVGYTKKAHTRTSTWSSRHAQQCSHSAVKEMTRY